MKKIACTLIMLFVITAVHGQEISRHEADALLQSLKIPNSPDSTRLKSLLALASFNILKPGEYKADLDSAETFMEKATTLNGKMRSPEAKGNLQLLAAYLSKERGQSMKELFANAVDALKSTKDKFHFAMAEHELSKFYDASKPVELSKKIRLLNNALSILRQAGTKEQKEYGIFELETNVLYGGFTDETWRNSYLNRLLSVTRDLKLYDAEFIAQRAISRFYNDKGNLNMAAKGMLELVTEYKEKNLPHICNVYDDLSAMYIFGADYRTALGFAFKAINSVESAADSAHLSDFYQRMVVIYSYFRMRDQCILWLKKSINYDILTKHTQNVFSKAKGIAHFSVAEGKPQEGLSYILDKRTKYTPETTNEKKSFALGLAECYTALKRYDLAEKYFSETIRLLSLQVKNGEIPFDFAADQSIGRYYLQINQFRKAKIYILKVINELPKGYTHQAIQNQYLDLFKVDSALGNFIAAIKDIRYYQALKDSTYDTEKTKQLEELQITYETKQRQKDIALLQSKSKIQQINLDHAKNTRNWILAGTLMLLILIGIIYNRYLLKQKSNRTIIHKNELLQHMLTEKEWLLKEVHHRVKNNLHTVICLLESQAAYLENDALKAIENSQHRIYAMSLIHQKLYQSDDIKTIDMSQYLPEFVRYLNDGFGTQGQICFQLNIDPIKLGVSQAIPIGLIINEAVTNAIKYAFPGNRKGLIEISMHQTGDNITLLIADNGIGIDPAIAIQPSNSLGLKLMKGLSDDINSEMTISNDNGTRIMMCFNVDPLMRSNNSRVDLPESEIFT